MSRGREERAPAAARPSALGECAARPLPPSLVAQAPISVAGPAFRGTPAAALAVWPGAGTRSRMSLRVRRRRGPGRAAPCSRPLRRRLGASGPGLRAAAVGQASARAALQGTRGGRGRVRPAACGLSPGLPQRVARPSLAGARGWGIEPLRRRRSRWILSRSEPWGHPFTHIHTWLLCCLENHIHPRVYLENVSRENALSV